MCLVYAMRKNEDGEYPYPSYKQEEGTPKPRQPQPHPLGISNLNGFNRPWLLSNKWSLSVKFEFLWTPGIYLNTPFKGMTLKDCRKKQNPDKIYDPQLSKDTMVKQNQEA